MMEYKGYVGNVKCDTERNVLRGEVINTRDVITYEGASMPELRKAFEDSVDDYLVFCQERGESPEKPFSGNFQVRISPNLHRKIYTLSRMIGQSLNSWVAEKLKQAALRHSRRAGQVSQETVVRVKVKKAGRGKKTAKKTQHV